MNQDLAKLVLDYLDDRTELNNYIDYLERRILNHYGESNRLEESKYGIVLSHDELFDLIIKDNYKNDNELYEKLNMDFIDEELSIKYVDRSIVSIPQKYIDTTFTIGLYCLSNDYDMDVLGFDVQTVCCQSGVVIEAPVRVGCYKDFIKLEKRLGKTSEWLEKNCGCH